MKKFISKISTALLSLFLLGGALSAAACQKADAGVDYVSQAKLEREYEGKDFLKDGIGRVTLAKKIDGDTAHFKSYGSSNSGVIKGRYECVDTPESTGMVEPWGAGASAYNGKLLNSAKTIVISTDTQYESGGTKPETDSTGGRFMVYVWVSKKNNAKPSELKLVNLALTQKGWSKAKGVVGKDYEELFMNASVQAQKQGIHVWSEKKDPDFNYNSPTTEVTLKQIIDGVDAEGKEYDWVGSKARFRAYVALIGPDQGACFVNKDFTWEENGETITQRYGIYIFTSYTKFAPLQTIGNEVLITGLISDYEGVKQVVAVQYAGGYYDEVDPDDLQVLSTGNKIDPIEASPEELAQDKYINVAVKATLKCTGGYETLNPATAEAYSFSLYCCDPNDPSKQLNIYIVDSIIIYDKTQTGRKRVTDHSYFQNATSITITGGLVTYTTSSGKLTYQIKLAQASGIEVNFD